MKVEEIGIYIHIPFCKSKCYYCDFTSYTDCKKTAIEAYIQNVIKEMATYDFSKYNVTTIYIGGGTPSFIPESYMSQLLEELKQRLVENQTKWEKIEITIEVNPGTITSKKLETYQLAGINRISIGLQTTNDKLLKQIGRIHNYQEFQEAYQEVKKMGFENINVDLMIGLPNQTIEDIKASLEEIQKLEPTHVSVYSLIVEEGTQIDTMLAKRKIDITRRRFRKANVLVCKEQATTKRI